MTDHLYVLALGPVQDFIAAARTTRDLWFGSHLLSEISKAAAWKIAEDGGMLIFPALEKGDPDLNPGKDSNAFNVANIILAELPEGMNPEDINKAAKDAAQKRWMFFAEVARGAAGTAVDEAIWKEQINDVIEFYSAWVPFTDIKQYQSTRTRLMRLLAARKSTRNFEPAKSHWGNEKSSLDGARDSVLKKESDLQRDLIIRMRLKESEELCAVGLTKRLGSGNVSFPSVVRVAVDPWIRGIVDSKNVEAIKILEKIREICERNTTIASKYSGKLYKDFPYDSQILFPDRLNAMKKTSERKQGKGKSWMNYLDEGDRKDLDSIKEHLIRLQRKGTNDKNEIGFGFGEPNPYLAVLVADGDQMGKAISAIDDSERHREFSTQLSKFAREAKKIIEDPSGLSGEDGTPKRSAHGCVVYTGGDDVLAFLPADTCIATARALHEKFAKLLNGFPLDPKNETGKTPSLSVGIAIVHSLEPLEDILAYGRDAEKAAKKPDRNGLAVHLHTRGGGDPTKIREQWSPTSTSGNSMSIDQRLEKWVNLHIADDFPDGAAYDLQQLAEDYKAWKPPIPPNLLEKDVTRLLARKRAGSGTRAINEDDLKKLTAGIHQHEDLKRRAEELVLTRRIAEVTRQTGCRNSRKVQS
nr:type III-B CRISPR-associated protein Cas10/Cmr2 [uncultured Methanoregula sp.]